MQVSEDGKSLIPDEFDHCRTEAWRIYHEWLKDHPGKIVIVDDGPRDALVHRIAYAIWEAKGRPTMFNPAIPRVA